MSKKKEVILKYPYRSRFGSDKSMVTKIIDENTVECEDEHGLYKTQSNRLDNGLHDPNRTDKSRLGKLFSGTKKEKEEKR